MIYRTNIIAYNISTICKELILVLNQMQPTDDIKYVLTQCININKSLVGLDDYYLYQPDINWISSIIIDFYFRFFPERITIKFVNNDYYTGGFCYSAEVITPLLITCEPQPHAIDGLLYCGKYNRILYISQFTKESYYILDDISCAEITKGYRPGVLERPRNNFESFIEHITQEERRHLKILNVEKEVFDEPDLEEYIDIDIRDLIDKYNINCIVTDNDVILEFLKRTLHDSLSVYSYNQSIPPINKEEWTKRAVTQVHKYFSYEVDRTELPLCIFLLKRDYHIPQRIMLNACSEILDNRDVEAIKRRGFI